MTVALNAIRCGNGTNRGGICKRWVPVGGHCPNHGTPFIIRYPDPDDLFTQALLTYWAAPA